VAVASIARDQKSVGAHSDLASVFDAQQGGAGPTATKAALASGEGQIACDLNRASVGHHDAGSCAIASAITARDSVE
jgi:hypothetical protein